MSRKCRIYREIVGNVEKMGLIFAHFGQVINIVLITLLKNCICQTRVRRMWKVAVLKSFTLPRRGFAILKLQEGDATTEAQPLHFVRNAVLGRLQIQFGIIYAKRL